MEYITKKYVSSFDQAATLEELSANEDDFLLIQGGKIERFSKIVTDSQTKFVLISSQDINGPKEYYKYDPSTLLLSEIANTEGRSIRITWNADVTVAAISSAENTVTYHYDSPKEIFPSLHARGRLRSVDYIDNVGRIIASKHYQYDDSPYRSHMLTGVIDENDGRYARYAYDSTGRATLSEHGDGADRYTIAYPDGNTRVVTGPSETVRTIGLVNVRGVSLTTGVDQPGGSGCSASSNTFVRDAAGNIVSQTDFNGNKICFVYEPERRLEIARVVGLTASAACPATVKLY